jgi:peptidoglycan hydrolase-like protein with peptidoglycan-binding domain
MALLTEIDEVPVDRPAGSPGRRAHRAGWRPDRRAHRAGWRPDRTSGADHPAGPFRADTAEPYRRLYEPVARGRTERALVSARRLAAGLTAALVLAGSAAVTVVPAAGAAVLPDANMEAIVLAAQRDPVKSGTQVTPGSGPSVLLVERALAARGLLASQYVDGHFGTSTISAYAAYQRSLGFTGLDASGLPGRTSLTRLGTDRFRVVRPIGPGERVTYLGRTVNTRTRAMLQEAQRRAGRSVALTQGSYNPGGDSTSAGTHDGGGAVDISVSGMTATVRTGVVRQLREVGFAAWYRSAIPGVWGPHIHAVAVSDTDLSPPAQEQVGDYYLGRDGLAGDGPDTGPAVTKRTWEDYQRSR